MARARYYVVKNGERWKIIYDGKDYHYNTQADAMKAAVDAAHKAQGDAQVLVQGRDGKWQTEWTYGHDPYPPRG